MKNYKGFGAARTSVLTITVFKNHSDRILTKHLVAVHQPQRLHFGVHVFALFHTEISQEESQPTFMLTIWQD
jgi:hypothetical protein